MTTDEIPSYLHGAPCKAGDPIRLIQMGNDPDPMPSGTTGIVDSVCPMGKEWAINVNWDSRRCLTLIYPEDSFTVLPYAAKASLSKLTMDQLTEALEQFCKREKLPHEDAANLVLRDEVTPEQRDWLTAFNTAWNGVTP